MQFIMKIFGWPLGFVMLGCYLVTGSNYALAITLFTLITKLALLPLSVKQQKEQAKMAVFQPKLKRIQEKYGNNKERYNEEIQKLYTEEGYNPMSGCLPSLIQFPILFGVIDVVYKPIYHIFRVSNAVIEEMMAVASAAGHAFEAHSYYNQIKLLKIIQEETALFADFDQEVIAKIAEFDMTLFGLDLGVVPQFALTYEGAFNWYLLIPILCGVFQLAMTFYMQKSNPSQQGSGSMNIMLYMMPLMSVYIGFIVPAAAGFYWTLSAVAQFIQSVFFNIFLNPKKLAEQAEAEAEAAKEAKKAKRAEARERLKELQREKNEKYAKNEDPSQKEINRKKLAEARKRAAEKYGDEYVEVSDDDLK
ncbi:MAG: YidC/Oxa1 family membrane protein insertase [Oscillospiraceae bacterium]|nr:YidC/Oxa1 family membrane protein insertase [Oscillospiraceae bacterium]MBR3953746.1 YidC/Oxa1 family membrane protein insertase [Oscillospiraceae bacterium]